MCPLVAPDGSPWTGQKSSPCPTHSDKTNGGCGWWPVCSNGDIHAEVEQAAANGGRSCVVGPNAPKRDDIGPPKIFDCPRAQECSWQASAQRTGAGRGLCPPRYALSRGIDPRVALF